VTRVDIGVATYGFIAQEWWKSVTVELLREQANGLEIGELRVVSSALPDHNKNYLVDDRRGIASAEEKGRNERTDANKSTIAGGFLAGRADWLFLMDDDTVPPPGCLRRLLDLGRDFVGALYFLAKPPHNPIAYFRKEGGVYAALWNYPHGALMQVDSIGMGCTLLHRSVFEKVMEAYQVFQRPNGSLVPVMREHVEGVVPPEPRGAEARVVDGVLEMPVTLRDPDDNRPWPFYAMEYGRTEDHHFCELTGSVGIRPWLDTSLVCDHFKLKAVNRTAHRMMVDSMPVDYGDEQVNELAPA